MAGYAYPRAYGDGCAEGTNRNFGVQKVDMSVYFLDTFISYDCEVYPC